MGMFDTIIVKKNNFNIPEASYQTKDLDCVLAKYEITENNEFNCFDTGVAEDYNRMDHVNQIKAKTYSGIINIYTDYRESTSEGTSYKWYEYYLRVKDNTVIEVTKEEPADYDG
jgi:hypothetical protein